MKTSRLVLIVIGAIMATDVRSDENANRAELEKLRGTWITVSLVNDGKALDQKSPPKLVYEGDKWAIKAGDKIFASGVFKVDATKSPKQIDILDDSGKPNEKTKLGIYEIDGDTYKFCLAPAGKPRPTEFASKAGTGHSLGVCKREKADK